jgi:hypothetical protein
MVLRAVSLVSLASLLAVGMGCSSSKSSTSTPAPADGIERLPDLKPTEPTANGFQIVMPIVRGIVPGASQEMCTWTDKVLTEDINVKSATGYQTKTGHHIVVYYTTKQQPAGTTRECKDEDMASFRIVIGTGGEGIAAALPADLATKIPAGAQIVINHHYLNAGADSVDAQSAVNVEKVTPGTQVTQSGNVAMLDTSLRLKPGPSGLDIHCKIQKDLRFWMMTPHMHAWGTHFTVDHQKVADNSSSRLVDVQWDPDYAFHPPEMTHDPAQPYMMKAGDQMTVHCDFNNTTPTDLTFGTEMCVFFGQTVDIDGQGSIACDAGNWGDF